MIRLLALKCVCTVLSVVYGLVLAPVTLVWGYRLLGGKRRRHAMALRKRYVSITMLEVVFAFIHHVMAAYSTVVIPMYMYKDVNSSNLLSVRILPYSLPVIVTMPLTAAYLYSWAWRLWLVYFDMALNNALMRQRWKSILNPHCCYKSQSSAAPGARSPPSASYWHCYSSTGAKRVDATTATRSKSKISKAEISANSSGIFLDSQISHCRSASIGGESADSPRSDLSAVSSSCKVLTVSSSKLLMRLPSMSSTTNDEKIQTKTKKMWSKLCFWKKSAKNSSSAKTPLVSSTQTPKKKVKMAAMTAAECDDGSFWIANKETLGSFRFTRRVCVAAILVATVFMCTFPFLCPDAFLFLWILSAFFQMPAYVLIAVIYLNITGTSKCCVGQKRFAFLNAWQWLLPCVNKSKHSANGFMEDAFSIKTEVSRIAIVVSVGFALYGIVGAIMAVVGSNSSSATAHWYLFMLQQLLMAVVISVCTYVSTVWVATTMAPYLEAVDIKDVRRMHNATQSHTQNTGIASGFRLRLSAISVGLRSRVHYEHAPDSEALDDDNCAEEPLALCHILSSSVGYAAFMHHLCEELSMECLLCVTELIQFQQMLLEEMDFDSDSPKRSIEEEEEEDEIDYEIKVDVHCEDEEETAVAADDISQVLIFDTTDEKNEETSEREKEPISSLGELLKSLTPSPRNIGVRWDLPVDAGRRNSKKKWRPQALGLWLSSYGPLELPPIVPRSHIVFESATRDSIALDSALTSLPLSTSLLGGFRGQKPYSADYVHLAQRRSACGKVKAESTKKRSSTGFKFIASSGERYTDGRLMEEQSSGIDLLAEDCVFKAKWVAHALYRKYVAPNSPFEVNVSYRTRKVLVNLMGSRKNWLLTTEVTMAELFDLFDDCAKEVYALMQDSFRRFANTKAYSLVKDKV